MNWYKYSQVGKISLQESTDRGMFGPVFHGTTSDAASRINEEGFKLFIGDARSGDVRHGFENLQYGTTGTIAPVHFLGYGIYFTTSKSIAKQFNQGSGVGLKVYYLDVPRLATINWGSPNTMMKWWKSVGYNSEVAAKDRVAATMQMTNVLKSQYDAVWYKGKGLYRLLDGDQVCVYDTGRIYEIDKKLAQPGQVGARVRRKSDGMIGDILKRENIEGIVEKFPGAASWVKPGSKYRLTVRWRKGGTDYNVQDVDVDMI